MTPMTCEETIRAAEAGEELSEGQIAHITDCAVCSGAARREASLTELLRQAGRVPVPGSFDSSLRRKIESRKAGGTRTRLLKPGYLVPVAASLLAAAVVAVLFALYSPPRAVETADVPAPVTEPSGPVPVIPEPAEEIVEAPVRTGPGAEAPAKEKAPVPPGSEARDVPPGGSVDLATSEARRMAPPWLSPDAPRDARPNLTERKFTPSEILRELGIEAAYTSAGWKVLSVKSGGIAARSGVEKGDVVKALDEIELASSPVTGGSISGRSLKVERDGRTLTLAIRP